MVSSRRESHGNFPIVQAKIGLPLGHDSKSVRPHGWIGGVIGDQSEAFGEIIRQKLGRHAQIMRGAANTGDFPSPVIALVADWDVCHLDSQPLLDLQQWAQIVIDGRLADVEGIFVIAWQTQDGTLCLARDGIGGRNLYYSILPHGLAFASSLAAISAIPTVAHDIHLPALGLYLCCAYIPGRRTLLQSIDEVLPGEIVRYCQGGLERFRFWDLPAESKDYASQSEECLRMTLRHHLEQAVTKFLVPDQPVGASLSGGIDSSLVVALATRLHNAPIHTYSISFGPEYANELPFSSIVAEHCRTHHKIVELPAASILHYLDQTISHLSKPIGDPLTVPNALLFREAARDVGIVLNGEGGDPCFGGPKNYPMLLAEWFGDWTNSNASETQQRECSYLRSHEKCYDDLQSMLKPDVWHAILAQPPQSLFTPYFGDPRWKSFVNKLMAINIACKGVHHILSKINQLSAVFGLLPRAPLFERHVVDFSFAIPPQLKLKGTIEKYLLKQAVADLLPAAILTRPKSGMLVPVEKWFQSCLLAAAKERLLDGLKPYGLIEQNYMEKLLDGRLPGLYPRRGVKIWLLITLESWLRNVLKNGR